MRIASDARGSRQLAAVRLRPIAQRAILRMVAGGIPVSAQVAPGGDPGVRGVVFHVARRRFVFVKPQIGAQGVRNPRSKVGWVRERSEVTPTAASCLSPLASRRSARAPAPG